MARLSVCTVCLLNSAQTGKTSEFVRGRSGCKRSVKTPETRHLVETPGTVNENQQAGGPRDSLHVYKYACAGVFNV